MQAGAKWLGITSVEEGVALRRLCPKVRILVMRGLMHGEADALIDAQLIPTVWEPQQLAWLADAAQKHKLALGTVPIHLEIDSGMSRQGVGLADLATLLDTLQNLPALRLSGVYTHFASADMLDAEQNQLQRAGFRNAVDQIFAAGFHPQWIHAGNSSTLLSEQHRLHDILPTKPGAKNLIRPGIALYGYAPKFSGIRIRRRRSSPRESATRPRLENCHRIHAIHRARNCHRLQRHLRRAQHPCAWRCSPLAMPTD